MIEPSAATGDVICSRAECTNEATWLIYWRNPRIHAADRTKTWSACDEHHEFLTRYLESRGFPVSTESRSTR